MRAICGSSEEADVAGTKMMVVEDKWRVGAVSIVKQSPRCDDVKYSHECCINAIQCTRRHPNTVEDKPSMVFPGRPFIAFEYLVI